MRKSVPRNCGLCTSIWFRSTNISCKIIGCLKNHVVAPGKFIGARRSIEICALFASGFLARELQGDSQQKNMRCRAHDIQNASAMPAQSQEKNRTVIYVQDWIL